MKRISLVASAIALAALTGLPTMAEEAEIKERVRPRMGPIARFDKNGDGILDADELKTAKDEVVARIDKLDLNGDGIVDREEVERLRAEMGKRLVERRAEGRMPRQDLEQRRQKMRERGEGQGEGRQNRERPRQEGRERGDGRQRDRGRGQTAADAPVIVD